MWQVEGFPGQEPPESEDLPRQDRRSCLCRVQRPPPPAPSPAVFPLLPDSQRSLFAGSAPEVFKGQTMETLEGCQVMREQQG